MSKIIYAAPNQSINLIFTVLNSLQQRTNAVSLPIVTNVYKPDITLLSGFPLEMTNIDVGLYLFNIILPMGQAAIGTYIINISWIDPDTLKQRQTHYQIICKPKPNAAGEYVISRDTFLEFTLENNFNVVLVNNFEIVLIAI